MSRQLSHIWFIALKDLKLFATDRGALFFFIVFPFFFVALFTFLNPGGGGEDTRLELHVVTQEAEGGLSQEIIAAMETKDDQQLQPGEPRIVWDKDYDEARQAVEDKELGGFLAFPADFTEGVFMGYGTQLEVVADAEDINTRAALNGLAKAIASQVGSQQVTAKAAIALLVEEALATSGNVSGIEQAIIQLFSGQGGTATDESFIEFGSEEVGGVEPTNAADYAIPGYLVMFVFFAAALSAEAIVRERQNRTLERLLASSVRREAILGGMFTGTAAKGLIQVLTLWVVGILVFSVDVGQSPAAVILLSILTVIMSSAFGIMLATLVKTQRSAGSIAVLASLVLAPLGGCWWPLFVLPKWMQFIAMLTPHGWATTGFNKLMLFGADFSAVVPEMLALVCFGAAFGIVAVLRFRTSAA
jgi:ABC-2 type transport system permease protein